MQASKLIPRLSNTEVTSVLRKALLLDEYENLAKFLRDDLNDALRTYVVDRNADLGARGASAVPRSRRIKDVENVTKQVSRLIKLVWKEGDPIAESTQVALRRAWHGPAKKKGTSFESDPTLERVKESVELLLMMARAALKREQKLEEDRARLAAEGKMHPRGSHTRNTGNQAMNELFITLTAMWVKTFHELPSASANPVTNEVSGKFVRFVQELFAAFQNRLPNKLRAINPDLSKKLKMSASAIRGYLRRTSNRLEDKAKSN